MKQIFKKTFLKLKGDKLLKQINKTPRVLFWHGVDNIVDNEVEAESFDVDVFRSHINYLANNFEIISIDEFHKRFKDNNFTHNEIVLTFDDGYSNNLNTVAPILNKKSLPFTVFISTEHIETGTLFPTSIARLIILGSELKSISVPSIDINKVSIAMNNSKANIYSYVSSKLKSKPLVDVRKIVSDLINNLSETQYTDLIEKYKSVKPMTWDEVVRIHQLGATIGSHCKYHICCHAAQDDNEVKEQIFDSKRIIEDKLNDECRYFAYPNGNYTDNSNFYVKEAGYKLGFSTDKNNRIKENSDKSIIPRIGVPQNIETFKIYVNLYPNI